MPAGLGIVVESSTVIDVLPPLGASGSVVPLHVITPTVPTPVLLDGRPQ